MFDYLPYILKQQLLLGLKQPYVENREEVRAELVCFVGPGHEKVQSIKDYLDRTWIIRVTQKPG